jgi:hypothetical protein
MYEIVSFEYSTPYDGNKTVSRFEVVKEFINQYRKYLYSEHINQSDIDFAKGRLWLSYADATGGDKPMTIMLFGDITTSLELEIKEAINNLYIVKCEDCDSVMEGRKKTGFLYCKKCNES